MIKTRIIGGCWRRRNIITNTHNTQLRPTTDRLRETLFNWLSPHVEGMRCLDLFSGTGILGFEALSRGAKYVDFVEKNKKCYLEIKKNIKTLKCYTNTKTFHMDAFKFIHTIPKASYDLIFLDAPFNDKIIPEICLTIHALEIMKQSGFVFIEMQYQKNIESLNLEGKQHWELLREKKIGMVLAQLYRVSKLKQTNALI